MHAFLLIGNNSHDLNIKIEELAQKLSAKIINFPLIKIDEVRDLNNLLRLTFSEPTLIVSKDIQNSGEEALNAFLKNLEEPQKNIYFVLTAPSEKSVLSTIVSRCQLIKSTNIQMSKSANDNELKSFLDMSKGEKLFFFDKLKERDKAIEFINNLIYYLYEKKDLTNMEILLTTLNNIKKNGNVLLHLTNLVARMENA